MGCAIIIESGGYPPTPPLGSQSSVEEDTSRPGGYPPDPPNSGIKTQSGLASPTPDTSARPRVPPGSHRRENTRRPGRRASPLPAAPLCGGRSRR